MICVQFCVGSELFCEKENQYKLSKAMAEAANLTHYQMTKLAHDEDITTDIIRRICIALKCKAEDIFEFVD